MVPSMGLLNTLAVLQAWTSTHDLHNLSEAQIGWIFSSYAFFLYFGGAQVGKCPVQQPTFDGNSSDDTGRSNLRRPLYQGPADSWDSRHLLVSSIPQLLHRYASHSPFTTLNTQGEGLGAKSTRDRILPVSSVLWCSRWPLSFVSL